MTGLGRGICGRRWVVHGGQGHCAMAMAGELAEMLALVWGRGSLGSGKVERGLAGLVLAEIGRRGSGGGGIGSLEQRSVLVVVIS